MTERELTIDGCTVCGDDYAYKDRSVIIYSDKEVFEYDLYWALKGTLAYNIVSIQGSSEYKGIRKINEKDKPVI